MSDVLKGVPCDDCYGTYDNHESGCFTLELTRLREENARLVADAELVRLRAFEEGREVFRAQAERMKAVVDAAREFVNGPFGNMVTEGNYSTLCVALKALDERGSG